MTKIILAVSVLTMSRMMAGNAAGAGDDDTAALRELIRPAAGESRWMEIEWRPSVWEARQIAAREGKPIFLMAGSGGAPCAGC